MATAEVDISDLLTKCQAALMSASPTQIVYTDRVNTEKNALPAGLASSPVNVYALWIRAAGSSTWRLMHIGQRSVTQGWNRVREHLFRTLTGTQSKLEKVRDSLRTGADIGVTSIHVHPDSLRLAVEEELIRKAYFRNVRQFAT